jgi:predicted anti-sigma-YlaC factor YlaD
MFCDEVLDQIEPIASGDVTPSGRVATHLASCGQCRAALEDARRVEQLLRTRARQAAPPNFTARTMSRLRRERWRSEQALDLGFNVALALVALGVVAAGWLAVRLSGLDAVGTDAVSLFGEGVAALARRVAPSVPVYAGATLLLVAALGIWWWAERDASA